MDCSATKPAVPGDPGQREEDIALKRGGGVRKGGAEMRGSEVVLIGGHEGTVFLSHAHLRAPSCIYIYIATIMCIYVINIAVHSVSGPLASSVFVGKNVLSPALVTGCDGWMKVLS